MRTLFLLIVLGGITALPSLGWAQTYRVGTGCTYATIQDAVNAIPNQGSGTVRVRTGTYGESVVIVNRTVTIIGGHTSCSATSPSPTALSAVDATGTNAPAVAFMVTGGAAGTSHSLQIRQINLANGTGVVGFLAPFPGGGLSVWTDADRSANVTLHRVGIFDNTTEYTGGGVALDGNGSGSLVLLDNSRIFSNTVTGDDAFGGGLYCSGNYNIVMRGGSVNSNTAGSASDVNGRGGGLYLDGCTMSWFAHASTGISTDDASLRHNTVYGRGGGLYATGGASVFLRGAHDSGTPASSRPLQIHGNESQFSDSGAAGAGGAMYMQGAGTTVIVDRGWVFDNTARSAGGAAYVSEGAELNIERSNQACHSPRNCSRLFGNHANSGGGAVFAFDNSQANIQLTKVANNTLGSLGTVAGRGILSAAAGSTVRLEDSLLYGTMGSGHALTANDGTLRVHRSTIADTSPFSTLGVFGLNGTSTLQIWDSIIHEADESRPIVKVHGGTPSVSSDCVIWHDDALAALGSATRTMVTDPMFIDRSKGSYRLREDSRAINFCNVAPPPPGVDLDWNPRGITQDQPPVLYGAYDLGAYEIEDAIFRDRFEN